MKEYHISLKFNLLNAHLTLDLYEVDLLIYDELDLDIQWFCTSIDIPDTGCNMQIGFWLLFGFFLFTFAI